MVKAGECARSHRHTANALRFVIETGPGAYTIVDGKKIPMEAGDVLLTPNWLWHGHQNESTEDAYWMDFLDVPLVHLLGPMFFEQHPEEIEKTDIVAADSPCRFAWSDTIQRLNDATELAPGIREIELGAPALDTIALHVRRLDPGATMEVEASTLSAIHAVMQGNGTVAADGKTFEWGRGDAIAMPSSTAASWSAQSESYLLQVSDKPLLEKLNWLRPIEN
jgi:gentisate 1,2-dioxygenase